MKKKLFAMLMAAAMVFGMTACGSGESADTTAETTGDEAQLEDFSDCAGLVPRCGTCLPV